MDYAALIQLIMQLSQQKQQQAQELGESAGSGDTGGTFKAIGKATHSKTATAIGGYLSKKKEKKEAKKLKRKIEKARQVTRALQLRGGAQQEAFAREATRQQLSGFDIARKEASRLGRTSKQGFIDEGQRLGAHLSQDLTNRGLGSTTVGGNLQRGISADVQRGIGGVNEGLSQIFGDLALGRSQAESAGTSALAELAAQQTNLGINDAQFWLPQMLGQFGQFQGLDMARRYSPGAPYGGQGIDMSMLASLFNQQGRQQKRPEYSGALGGGYTDASISGGGGYA